MPEYAVINPDRDLSPWIRCFWSLRDEGNVSSVPERILPDGCSELIFHFAEPYREVCHGEPVRQPASLLVAAVDRPIWIIPAARSEVFAVRFQPGAVSQFFAPASIAEVTGGVHPARDVLPFLAALQERFAPIGDAERAALMSARLRAELARRLVSRADPLLVALRSSHGTVSIESLAADAGISLRQAERRIRSLAGVGPKRLARVLRFHAAVESLLHAPETALLEGYFDQSHWIRDFREFAETTPAAFLREQIALNSLFHSPAGPGPATA
ncbi:MAG TPA: helix-turn-helix domain-containing protein [Thermoanaerobaculia bacterium]|nr:helix-turn-helix domain-containing protein [Thermoanaerobaculia bacterium]